MPPLLKTKLLQKLVSFAEKAKEKSEDTQNNPGNQNSGAINSIPNNNTKKNNNKNFKYRNRAERSEKLFVHPVSYVKRQTTLQRKTTMEKMQQKDYLPGTKDR